MGEKTNKKKIDKKNTKTSYDAICRHCLNLGVSPVKEMFLKSNFKYKNDCKMRIYLLIRDQINHIVVVN